MGKAKKYKSIGRLQRMHDQDLAMANSPPVLNDFARQHGDYEYHLARTINRGGTALERWDREGKISETQKSAIVACQRLWARLGAPSRGLVSDYLRLPRGAETIGTDAYDASERLAAILGSFPPVYRAVFENVCRFDEPAGQIGSRLLDRPLASAADAARLCVCMVADMIALRERL